MSKSFKAVRIHVSIQHLSMYDKFVDEILNFCVENSISVWAKVYIVLTFLYYLKYKTTRRPNATRSIHTAQPVIVYVS